jgi:hypothetical protein
VHPELLEAMAAGKISGIEELITRRVAIEDVVEKGFLTLVNDKDSQGKHSLRSIIATLTMPLSSENSYTPLITEFHVGRELPGGDILMYCTIGTLRV